MAKANKKAKAAAPKKAPAKSVKAAAPKKAPAKSAAPKKGQKAAAPAKKVAMKKGSKAAAPKKAQKATPPKKLSPSKKVATKKSVTANPPSKKVAAKKSAPTKQVAPKKVNRGGAPSADQRPMLEALFIDHLKDIYFAEKHLVKALSKMARASTSPDLKQAFEQHQQVSMEQISRLEQVFELVGKRAQGKKCDAMVGLVLEAESAISDTEKGSNTRDVALIIAAQKAEHYEIASYGGLATLASVLGLGEAKELLGQTLAEEKQTDELLTQLAENNINQDAEAEGGSEDTSEDEEEEAEEAEEAESDSDDEEAEPTSDN